MDSLATILEDEIRKYAIDGLNSVAYLLVNDARTVYSILTIAQLGEQQLSGINLIARLQDGQIIIDKDGNNKPFAEALMQAGVARTQIVLTYQHEKPAQLAPSLPMTSVRLPN